MGLNFSSKTESLSAEAKLSFYEFLAHNLTISMRSIWLDPDISDSEKIELMKRINEILHRTISKCRVIRLVLHEWSEYDFEGMVKGWTGSNDRMRGEVLMPFSVAMI